jgi:regulator of protease activity HflC (stomatin/prohibitin superfamily)
MEILFVLLILVVLGLVVPGIRIIDQYERGIVLTLGTYSYTVGPGLKIIIPYVQRIIKVDMRISTMDIPKQEVITRDNVPANINAVVYFQVLKAEDAILKVRDFEFAISQYAQTALRDVIGGVELDTLLTERQKIADGIKDIVDQEISNWGVDVTAIKIQDIELPADMKKSMAKQAESERDRRGVVIKSQGELTASENLKKAMENLKNSGAISLRTLQTIEDTSDNPASTVVFALPIEILEGFRALIKKGGDTQP